MEINNKSFNWQDIFYVDNDNKLKRKDGVKLFIDAVYKSKVPY